MIQFSYSLSGHDDAETIFEKINHLGPLMTFNDFFRVLINHLESAFTWRKSVAFFSILTVK